MISIIVPVYKSEKTLTKCLESLVGQTYQDIEIIVVDDGSPDSSGKIAQEYSRKYSNIRVIEQPNAGVSAARNAGIEAAAGEYIQFLDSDDSLTCDACEILYGAIDSSNVDLVIAGYWHDYYGKRILKNPPFSGSYETRNAEPEVLALYREGSFNMPWNKLYKKNLITQKFPEDWKLGEDLIFNLNYLKNCSGFHVMQSPVCYYLQDERGTTLSSFSQNGTTAHTLLLYNKVLEFCRYLYQEGSFEKIIAGKVVEEFLNQISELAFCKTPYPMNKIRLMQEYIDQYQAFERTRKENGYQEEINKNDLNYVDHRILFFALKRGYKRALVFLSWNRSLIVRVTRSSLWK